MTEIIYNKCCDNIKTTNKIASIQLRLDGLCFSIVSTKGKCFLVKKYRFLPTLTVAENLLNIASQEPLWKTCYKNINIILTGADSTIVPVKLFEHSSAASYIEIMGRDIAESECIVCSPNIFDTISVSALDNQVVSALTSIFKTTKIHFVNPLQENLCIWQSKHVNKANALIVNLAGGFISLSVFVNKKMLYADSLPTANGAERLFYIKELVNRYPDVTIYLTGYSNTDADTMSQYLKFDKLPFLSAVYASMP